jgi:EmrB/QacA subfamily drug resistance transporter
MLMLDLTVVNVALPDLRTAFDASFSQLQWVLDAYALGLAVFLLTAGSLADRFGRKRVFNLGFVIFIVGSLACGAAPGADWLSLARGLQGLGGAILFAVGPALIGHEYRGPDRSTAFGVFGGVVGLAIAFGPLIGGLITENLSWRWIFLINVPVGLAALLAGLLRMRESSDLIARPVDRWGLVTFSGALGLLVLGFLRGEASGWSSPLIIGMFGASALLFAGFYAIERALGPNAMLDLSLFANVTFNGLSAVTLLNAAATMSAIFLQISYVQNVLGYSAWQAGLRFLPLTLTLFLAAAVAGGLTAKVPPRLLVGLSLTAIAGGLALVTRVTATSDWTALLPSMIVLGLGMGLFNPPRAALSISVVEPAKAGMASGIGETFQQVGVAVGIAAFGALFHARASHLFAHSAAGLALGPEAGSFGDAVAAGGGTPAAARVSPAPLAAQLDLAGRTAFTDGLREVMIVCALVAAVGAVIAFGFIRSRDLHDSAAGLEERTRI